MPRPRTTFWPQVREQAVAVQHEAARVLAPLRSREPEQQADASRQYLREFPMAELFEVSILIRRGSFTAFSCRDPQLCLAVYEATQGVLSARRVLEQAWVTRPVRLPAFLERAADTLLDGLDKPPMWIRYELERMDRDLVALVRIVDDITSADPRYRLAAELLKLPRINGHVPHGNRWQELGMRFEEAAVRAARLQGEARDPAVGRCLQDLRTEVASVPSDSRKVTRSVIERIRFAQDDVAAGLKSDELGAALVDAAWFAYEMPMLAGSSIATSAKLHAVATSEVKQLTAIASLA